MRACCPSVCILLTHCDLIAWQAFPRCWASTWYACGFCAHVLIDSLMCSCDSNPCLSPTRRQNNSSSPPKVAFFGWPWEPHLRDAFAVSYCAVIQEHRQARLFNKLYLLIVIAVLVLLI